MPEYHLVDSDCRLVVLPEDKVATFAASLPGATKATPGNLRALLEPAAQTSTARLGWESKMVKGVHPMTELKWIQRVGTEDTPIAIPNWDVNGWIERVAKKHASMTGLRSKQLVTKFIRGNELNGRIREVYGENARHCPRGWRILHRQPSNYADLLRRAPLPWDTVCMSFRMRLAPCFCDARARAHTCASLPRAGGGEHRTGARRQGRRGGAAAGTPCDPCELQCGVAISRPFRARVFVLAATLVHVLTPAHPFVSQAGASTAPAPADGSAGLAQQQVRRTTHMSGVAISRPFRAQGPCPSELENEECALGQACQA